MRIPTNTKRPPSPSLPPSSGRSRSEDSVYSPASEDGGSRSEGSTDSKSSLEQGGNEGQPTHHPHHTHHSHHHEGHHVFPHGLGALVALRKKRKTFSDSRSSTSGMRSGSGTNPIYPLATALVSKVSKKQQLQRASSVPTRGPELGQQPIPPRRHEGTQSQQPSIDTPEGASANEQPGKSVDDRNPRLTCNVINRPERPLSPLSNDKSDQRSWFIYYSRTTECSESPSCRQVWFVCVVCEVVPAAPLTPSTTEESVAASTSLPATMKRNGSATQLQRLPGIEPISGHDVSGGWL